jgi:hypothetical protein
VDSNQSLSFGSGTINDDSSRRVILEEFEVVSLAAAQSIKRQNMPRKDFLAINTSISTNIPCRVFLDGLRIEEERADSFAGKA